WQAVPASIVAVIVPTIVVVAMHPGVQTIGTKFGGIPSGFPAVNLPQFSFAQIQELMAPALTIAVLGAIESLLSAMVADGMIETRWWPEERFFRPAANLCFHSYLRSYHRGRCRFSNGGRAFR